MADMDEFLAWRFGTTGSNIPSGQEGAELANIGKMQREYVRALRSATEGLMIFNENNKEINSSFATFNNEVLVPLSQAKNLQEAQKYLDGLIQNTAGDSVKNLSQIPMYMLEFERNRNTAQARNLTREEVSRFNGTYRDIGGGRVVIGMPVGQSDYKANLKALGGDVNAVRSMYGGQLDKMLVGSIALQSKYVDAQAQEQRDRQDKEQQQKDDKEKKENTRKLSHGMNVVYAILVTIADITRRILTVALENASQAKDRAVSAQSIGVNYTTLRNYQNAERALGIPEGTLQGSVASVQSAFGSLKHLDDNALENMAMVLKSDTINAIKLGLGETDPEAVTKMIVNEFFAKAQSGYNSLGQYVGKSNAEREMATFLENSGFSDIATLVRQMFYINDTGIYRGSLSGGDSYSKLIGLNTAYTGGLTAVDLKKVNELGQVVDQLTNRFTLLKESVENKLIIALEGLVNWINALGFGKSSAEVNVDAKRNLESNNEVISAMKSKASTAKGIYTSLFSGAGIDFGALGYSNFDEFYKAVEGGKFRVNDSNAGAYSNLQAYLGTESGRNALYSYLSEQAYLSRASQAESDIAKGRKSGKIVFNSSLYTDTAIQQMVASEYERQLGLNSALTSTGKTNATIQATSGIGAVAGRPYSRGDVFDEIISTYYGGNLTYQDILNSNDSAVTDALYKRLPQVNKSLSKEQMVKFGLAQGYISQEDVYNTAKDLYVSTGKSKLVTGGTYESASGYLIDATLKNAESMAGITSVMTDVLNSNALKGIIAGALGEVQGSIGSYDPVKREVQVVLDFVDKTTGESQKKILNVGTDATLNDNRALQFKISGDSVKYMQR